MKKFLLPLAACLLSIPSFAQSYRGMFEIDLGTGISSDNTYDVGGIELKQQPSFGGAFSTTHGCQITPWLFAGVGFGASTYALNVTEWGTENGTTLKAYSLNVPLYLDLRWDMDVRRKVSPFIDLKMGYQWAFNLNPDNSCGNYYSTGGFYTTESALMCDPISGFYFQPTVGVRFRRNSKKGFGLGITYNTSIKRGVTGVRTISQNEYLPDLGTGSTEIPDVTLYDFGKRTYGALMLSLCFDF